MLEHLIMDVHDCRCCLFMQKRDTGQVLLDKVFRHLELHEKDYFGLQFASVVVPSVSDSVVSGALVLYLVV